MARNTHQMEVVELEQIEQKTRRIRPDCEPAFEKRIAQMVADSACVADTMVVGMPLYQFYAGQLQ